VSEEEKVREEEKVEVFKGATILRIVNSLVEYAVNSLPYLIVDKEENVIWPEAMELLVERTRGRDPTIEDILAVLNELVNGYDPAVLDKVIMYTPYHIRMLINLGISMAKAYIENNEEYARQIKEEGREIIRNLLMKNPRLARLFAGKDNLLNFIADYVCFKLVR
jgi:hypothetical protein